MLCYYIMNNIYYIINFYKNPLLFIIMKYHCEDSAVGNYVPSYRTLKYIKAPADLRIND